MCFSRQTDADSLALQGTKVGVVGRAVVRFAIAALALPAWGCGSLTEIVVSVDTDLAVPADIDRVAITVDGPGTFQAKRAGAVARAADFPTTLEIEGGDRLDEARRGPR